MKKVMLSTLAAASMLASSSAQAAISLTPNLTSVNVYEATYTINDGNKSFAANSPLLTQRLGGTALTAVTRDFGVFPGTENYDIFFSDASGNLDASGNYITIDGNCTVAYNCFNINGVSLTINGSNYFADTLLRAVYGRAGSFTPGSAAYAVDGSLATYTGLGDTIGLPADSVMSITVGFSQLSFPGAVPEPASWAMMILGFSLMGVAMRRTRTRSVRFA
jgi:hypothetical protein